MNSLPSAELMLIQRQCQLMGRPQMTSTKVSTRGLRSTSSPSSVFREVGFIQFRRGQVPAEILELADSAVFRTSDFKAGRPNWRGEFSEEFCLYLEEQLELPIDPA